MNFRNFICSSVIGVSLALGVTSVASVPLSAQELPAPKIMVIDLNYVMTNSTAMQGIQNQVDEAEAELESQMQEQGRNLRAQDEALSQQRSELSDEDFEERRRTLEEEFSRYQRDFAERLEGMDETYAEAVGEVEVELLRIADELASESGANIVMPKSTLLLVHEDFDRTAQALERLNERLPSVSISD